MKKIAGIGLIVFILILGLYVFGQDGLGKENGNLAEKNNETSNTLIPVESITHGHGLAVDVSDPSKLYIATHNGLLLLLDEKDLYQVGAKKDDYMGFSPHPSDPNIFFTSGHQSFGGNLGFQRSDDGGFTWEKVSDGIGGPVDFHTMTVSPVNPNMVYGWYNGALQRSVDGGSNWEIMTRNLPNVISLAADTKNEDYVFAATMQGLMQSTNKGKDWKNISDELADTAVTALAINPQDSQTMLSYSEKLGLVKSSDGGQTWEIINERFSEEIVLYIAMSKKNPQTVYALAQNNSLYKSTDGGNTWSSIR